MSCLISRRCVFFAEKYFIVVLVPLYACIIHRNHILFAKNPISEIFYLKKICASRRILKRESIIKRRKRGKERERESTWVREEEFKYKHCNCDSLLRRDGRRMDQMKPSKFQHPLRLASLSVLPLQTGIPLPFLFPPSSVLATPFWTKRSAAAGTKASSVKHTRCAGAGERRGGDDAKSARANGLGSGNSRRAVHRLPARDWAWLQGGALDSPLSGVGESPKCAPGCNIIPLGG